ncbi:MAG: DUF6036 family nucleotidyltransferase [Myxococcota bacterium]
MFLREVAISMSSHHVRYALVGGYAVALHGAVRGTVDIDLILTPSEENYVAAHRALEAIGLASRIPVTPSEVFQFRRDYIERRNLIAWSFVDSRDPTRLVDIILTHELKRLKVKKVDLGDIEVPILSKDELIKMKQISNRPQDLEDIQALKRLS